MKSPITGKEMTLKRENISLTFRKEAFTICNHYYHCVDSNEQFTSTKIDELNLVQLYNQYRDKHNLPFPNETLKTRKKYGLSASKMAEILGFGTNSYRKYENGEVPSNSNGRLIQMANDPNKFKDTVDLSYTLSEDEKSKLLHRIEALKQDSKEDAFSNDMEGYLLGSRLPDALSGYVKPDLSKLTEMVKYFADRLEPWKTVLNKLLFYSDFLAYRSNGFSMSGVRYRAIKMGPVPNNYDSIYEFMFNNNQIDIVNIPFNNDIFGFQFKKAKNKSFNTDLFSKAELEIMDKVYSHFSNMNTNQVIEFSHNEKAWIDNECERKLIDYNYAFEIDQI